MSNVNRPRTGMKPCQFDGSTERDSNGQCACRNTLYRLVQRAATADIPAVKVTFNDVLKKKNKGVDDAVLVVRQKFNYLAPKKAGRKPAPKKAVAEPVVEAVAEPVVEPVVEVAKPASKKYSLTLADGTVAEYARKDAAIKNGLRADQDWTVTSPSGTVVAQSDDLI